MATTMRTIIDQAYARSTFSDPGVLAQDAELIARANLRLAELFAAVNELATIEDAYFGKVLDVAPASSAWAKPSDLDVLLQLRGGINNGTGASRATTVDEIINLVPYNDRNEVPPAVYVTGGSYVSVGRTGDPSATANGEQLRFHYARFPAALDPTKKANASENTLDSAWPERFNNLLVVDLAKYLSKKDARFTIDGAALAEEEVITLDLLRSHVSRTNRPMRSRFGQRARVDALVNQGG